MDEISEKKNIRAFVCFTLSDEAIKEIARVQEILGHKMFTGKMTELENLHLTLKFLGEMDDSILEKVKERLKEIKFKSFEVKLGMTGTFSRRGNPSIVWIKVNGEEIWSLQKKIDESLKELFKAEERFMSHLTIARVKYVNDKMDFINYAKNIHVKEIKFNINSFKLMSSDLRDAGPVYTLIEEYKPE